MNLKLLLTYIQSLVYLAEENLINICYFLVRSGSNSTIICSLCIFKGMKCVRLKKLLFALFCLFSMWGKAQVSTEFDGKYVGKFDSGGFEDSLIISNGKLAHVRNAAWSYGVEHQFVYEMISLKGEMITLEQVHYFRDRAEFPPDAKLAMQGEMHEKIFVFLKDADDNLEIIVPGDVKSFAVFKKVQ